MKAEAVPAARTQDSQSENLVIGKTLSNGCLYRYLHVSALRRLNGAGLAVRVASHKGNPRRLTEQWNSKREREEPHRYKTISDAQRFRSLAGIISMPSLVTMLTCPVSICS